MPLPGATISGLTTGSIGFVITLYTTALDLYSVYSTASSLGRDAQVLQAQLFIQATLFKRWGDGLGLTKGRVEDVDERLKRDGDGSLFQAAVVGMSSIKQVLSDTAELKRSYGLDGMDEVTAGSQMLAELRGISLLDNAVVEADYKRRIEEAEKMQKQIGIMKKLKWTIVDKEKFGTLVERLTGLNNGLYSLIEPLEANLLSKAVVGELLRTMDVGRIRVLGAAARGTSNASDVASLAALRERALDILRNPDTIPNMDLPEKSKGLILRKTALGFQRTVGSYQRPNSNTSASATSVLVEWKVIEANLTGKERELLDKTTNSLAYFLSEAEKTSSFRSLTCLGITKPKSDSAESVRYGLVYQFPGSISNGTSPPTLYDMLGDDEREMDLGNKFRVAQILAQSLYEIHVANWLHKAICSENVIFTRQTNSSEHRISPNSVYLAGYEFSRPGRLRDPTQPAGDAARGAHAHPAYRDGGTRYRRVFDIYSLGVVLLEIGTWQRAAGSVRPGRTARDMQDLCIESCERELGPAMGRVYLNAVLCCLTGDSAASGLDAIDEAEPDWDKLSAEQVLALEEADEQMNADLTASFYWKVVQPLGKLYA
jgi:hypothetical protein